ncbi:MAG: hypothetical protein GY851_04395, partial [bacterium]|nr:hypothetical protein [bacterium]
DYSMMRAYQSQGWPKFVVIDPDGIIRFHGPPDDRKLTALRKCLNELLPEQAAPGDEAVLKDGICYPKSVVKAREAHRDRSPRVAVDVEGNPRIVYYSNRDGSNAIYVRTVEETDEVSDERITPLGGDCYAPDCVFDSKGTLWVVWCGKQGEAYDIHAWNKGPERPPATARLTRSTEDAMRPRIAAGPDGSLAVTYYKWRSMRGVSRDRDIFCRAYDPLTQSWG